MVDTIKQKANALGNRIASINPIVFLYFSIFLISIIYFWSKIVGLFKSEPTAKEEAAKVTTTNKTYLSNKSITPDGYFINGLGGKTKYRITEARQHAEDLSALLKTYRGAKWYSVTLSFFGMGSVTRVKRILNPNYPASFRRYVQEVYRTVYTDNKSLQTDVRAALTGFAGSSAWSNDLTKYFIN
ncbi:hypothetical protein DBR40_19890 [Pedobacter sp. KBW01]|uniref:hypothetical protein n=1 Tax=Pedobacter sp. KBW01 TaxID=2153364 RepID=UPI000F5AAC37|nr:hypothetical protein [Pedobacter sp. KBW01]RQO68505.1 hypothetical protein DBR40_19890 [Pedobacter sp. KBW01]